MIPAHNLNGLQRRQAFRTQMAKAMMGECGGLWEPGRGEVTQRISKEWGVYRSRVNIAAGLGTISRMELHVDVVWWGCGLGGVGCDTCMCRQCVCMGRCEVCIIIRIIRANQLFITCIISLRPIRSLCAGRAGVELNQIGDLATSRGCGRASSAADG